MKLSKLNQMENLMIKNEFKRSKSKMEIVDLFESLDYKYLIDDFEKSISSFSERKMYPHYSFYFYLSLICVSSSGNEEIANYIRGKKTYKYLFNGLKIFVSGKSKKLVNNIKLNYEDFNDDIYQYIDRFPYSIGMFKYSAIVYLLELIYAIDKNDFFIILESDKSNFFFLTFFSENKHMTYSNEIILKFLNSDDRIKSYSSVCYLMRDVRRNYIKYKECKDNLKELNKSYNNVCEILNQVSKEKRVKLILDYILTEDIYPPKFISMLCEVEVREEIIKNLESIKIDRIDKLVSLEVLLECDGINDYIMKFLMDRVCELIECNNGIYDISKFENFIKKINKEEIMNLYKFIEDIINKLAISEFDKQVRYVQFHRNLRFYQKLKELNEIVSKYMEN